LIAVAVSRPKANIPTFSTDMSDMGLQKCSPHWLPHFLSPAQNVAPVEALTEILQILHKSEDSHFEEIATNDESWFQHSDPSSKMFAQSPTDVIPRTRRAIRTKQTMITILLTGCNLMCSTSYQKEVNLTTDILSITFFPI
jgi:hypothetical protein